MISLDKIYFRLFNLYGKQGWWPADNDIELMIGSILVQNTNWNNVKQALKNFETFDGRIILGWSNEELIERIKPAGFYTRKASTIINLLSWFETYNFDKKNLIDVETSYLRGELLSIHGIGEETCDCILLYLFERPVFVVDSYLKKVLSKTGHPTYKKYCDNQAYMMEKLPNDVALFQEYHALVVEYGKQVNRGDLDVDPLVLDMETLEYSINEVSIMKHWIPYYGYLERPSYPDPYWGIVHTIIGQLISAEAASAISKRFIEKFPTKESINNATIESIKSVGLTQSKALYIYEFNQQVINKTFLTDKIYKMNELQATQYLLNLKGIGIWSAKIVLIHSYGFKDIAIYEDVALQNAVKKILGIKSIDRGIFNQYFEKYKPYRSIACVYHWYYIKNETSKQRTCFVP